MSRVLVNNFCTYCLNFERNPSSHLFGEFAGSWGHFTWWCSLFSSLFVLKLLWHCKDKWELGQGWINYSWSFLKSASHKTKKSSHHRNVLLFRFFTWCPNSFTPSWHQESVEAVNKPPGYFFIHYTVILQNALNSLLQIINHYKKHLVFDIFDNVSFSCNSYENLSTANHCYLERTT